jgi:hypothetical protein
VTRAGLPVPLVVVVSLLAGCGGGTKTTTVTSTQTVVTTVTTPPATTPTTTSTGTTPTTPVPSGPQSCGKIDITYPNGEGGSSAVNITAFGLGCTEARAVTRTCQRGNVTPGWRARLRGNSGVEMTSGSRRITFQLAGGGGCTPGP